MHGRYFEGLGRPFGPEEWLYHALFICCSPSFSSSYSLVLAAPSFLSIVLPIGKYFFLLGQHTYLPVLFFPLPTTWFNTIYTHVAQRIDNFHHNVQKKIDIWNEVMETDEPNIYKTLKYISIYINYLTKLLTGGKGWNTRSCKWRYFKPIHIPNNLVLIQ